MIYLQKQGICKNAYRVNFVFMSKNDALNLIKNSNIIDKKGVS